VAFALIVTTACVSPLARKGPRDLRERGGAGLTRAPVRSGDLLDHAGTARRQSTVAGLLGALASGGAGGLATHRSTGSDDFLFNFTRMVYVAVGMTSAGVAFLVSHQRRCADLSPRIATDAADAPASLSIAGGVPTPVRPVIAGHDDTRGCAAFAHPQIGASSLDSMPIRRRR
jgi:hypothetical protein